MPETFDDRAATWDDDPDKVARGRETANAVAAAVALDADTRLLEYGAGTGLASQALVGRVGSITLVDTSAGMRDVMAAKVADGVFPDGTRVWDLDLAADDPPDETFDVVLTLLALHHVADVDRVLAGFATLLAPGGHVCVVDLDEDPEGAFHREHPEFEGPHGFAHDDLARRMAAAGFSDVAFTPCGHVVKHDRTFPLFLAVGRRA